MDGEEDPTTAGSEDPQTLRQMPGVATTLSRLGAASRSQPGPLAPPEDDGTLEVPERIGPYRILEKLGEGGMGSVFLAEQTEPVRRRVALKVLRSTFYGREERSRFEAERQAMARLQHPNVAQIFDADATQEGNPYFVMEYVEGSDIASYCRQARLSIEDRLVLIGKVCSGVQHAHQKGILHRDLKPSNILVADTPDGRMVKIIDFGIAKTLDQPSEGGELLTGTRLIGTPAYLSPEAARVGEAGFDLDTRADVYALGILLYELLVGHRPFEGGQVNVLQIVRRISSEEPVPPSQRWLELEAAERDRLASERRMSPRALSRTLRRDLDWVVLRAIAKDRARRYGSANELAADLRRHLAHEPLEASPPSRLYRAKKFVRRRLGMVVACSLIVLALAAGFWARTLEAQRANREAMAATEAHRRAEGALLAAERAGREAEEVSKFLVDLFSVSDPGEAKGNSVTARELLDSGAEKIRQGLADQPLARARLMQTIGDVYRKLGLYEDARELFEEVLALRRKHLPPGHLETAQTLNGLAALEAQLGHFEAAEPLFEEALAIRQRQLGADDHKVAMSLSNLANLYIDSGRPALAEPLLLRSVEIIRGHRGPPQPDLLVALNNLASLYSETDRLEEAEPLLRQFVELQRSAHGPLHPHVAIGLANLAEVRWRQGELGEAEALYLEAEGILRQVLGAEHPEVAYCLSNVGLLYLDQQRLDEAASMLQKALAIQRSTLPEGHPERQASEDGWRRLQTLRAARG